MPSPKWIAVDEIGNDNFATSIYENDYKGLLVARCNQNGQHPWQAPAIIRGLENNKDRYGLALMMIREGCDDPKGFAAKILSAAGPS